MRRLLTAATAATLILSSVGSALAIEPIPSSGPSSTVDPVPSVEPSPVDPAGRWIVVLKGGTNAVAASSAQGRRLGFKADRTFSHAVRGFSARLDRGQVAALRGDPSVALVVPDEKIQLQAQTLPTGILRVGARNSPMAKIDGLDERVDADVAIVDTGIAPVADLNVAGGYNCSTSNRTAWRDMNGHGTHVSGTVAAIDNGSGVVGVAPGARLWAVKILDDSGNGLLSWYVCGLDWIAAQRDPLDASRPLFEAVNMSVAKWGRDDQNCGNTNSDVLHQAICRLVASGVTVVAAAANDSGSASVRVPAAYNEVITVSALADTDGKAGGLGGNRCFSWGTYDVDDTFADFSNFGSDVDLIAPGKCIWSTLPGGYGYLSGTSMAAPHVTGAAALLKATRPSFTPADVKEALQYLGNLNWKTSTDPDAYHERLLDVSRLGPRGDFGVAVAAGTAVPESGGAAQIPITLSRTATSFERIRLAANHLPAGMTASFDKSSLYGFADVEATLIVKVPPSTPRGTYPVTVIADEHGRVRTATASVVVEGDLPIARPPTAALQTKATISSTTLPVLVTWPAATDATSAIANYALQRRVDDAAWTSLASTVATVRTAATTQMLGHTYEYRVRARDAAGNWSGWAAGRAMTSVLFQDRSSAVSYSGTWTRYLYVNASGGSTTYATAAGARARATFTGRSVALIAPCGPTRGSAAIYVDGVYRGTVSFRRSTGQSRLVMFSTSFATLGSHTIDVRLSGNGRVDVDAFVIFR
jgi:subtilisin